MSSVVRSRGIRVASLLLLSVVGCSTPSDSAESGASGGPGGFQAAGDPATSGGTAGGATGASGTGGAGTGGALEADGGGTGGGSGTGGSGAYTGPLENVGDECVEQTECIQGLCTDKIMGYGDQPGGACTRSCSDNAECGSSGVCARALTGSQCLRSCQDDGNCRDGYFCSTQNDDLTMTGTKVCRPKPSGRAELEIGKVGGPCTDGEDCGTAGSCPTELERRTPAPNGYCSGPCFEDSDCGTSGLCVGELRTSAGVKGQCYEACTNKSSCEPGYECRAPFTADGSLLGLVSETVCLPPPPPTALTGTTTGELCTDDDACPGGVCETEVVGRMAMSGICTGTCTKTEQCGTNTDCYGANALAGTQGECLRRCTSITNCAGPTEHICTTVGFGETQKYCVPRRPLLEPVQMP